MVNLPGLQDTYDTGYQHFRKNSGFTPAEQEVVLLSLSVDNRCDYFTAAHNYLTDNIQKHLWKSPMRCGGRGNAGERYYMFCSPIYSRRD